MFGEDYSVLVQGSREWLQARCGKVTASRAEDATGAKKVKGQILENAARRDYRAEIISEILTGNPYPQHVTREMQWGLDQEPFARAAYELRFDVEVETVGFVEHPSIERFGCSPDGLVGVDGMLQIKCPTTATHLEWLIGGVIPIEHIPQLLAELACNRTRQWIDFASFDPRLPSHLELFVKRFPRADNEKLIAVLESEVLHFNAEVDMLLALLPQPAKILEIPIDDALLIN